MEELVNIDAISPNIINTKGKERTNDKTLLEEEVVEEVAIVVEHNVARVVNVLAWSSEFFGFENVSFFQDKLVKLFKTQPKSGLIW